MKELVGIILIALFIYSYNKNINAKTMNSSEPSHKDILIPKIKDNYIELQKKENNIITKFLLKIQMFYFYNEAVYEEIVEELEKFLVLYRSVNIDNSYGGVFYDLMNDIKRSILNNLRSFGIKLPIEYNLNSALNDLDMILNEYLNKTYYLYQNHIYKNGYDYRTKVIDRHNMAYNRFEQDIGSYSFY